MHQCKKVLTSHSDWPNAPFCWGILNSSKLHCISVFWRSSCLSSESNTLGGQPPTIHDSRLTFMCGWRLDTSKSNGLPYSFPLQPPSFGVYPVHSLETPQPPFTETMAEGAVASSACEYLGKCATTGHQVGHNLDFCDTTNEARPSLYIYHLVCFLDFNHSPWH